ncbi:MAG TPA: response regulator [Candidatus Omnitrophica bacterium]|nr:response regulator [Candidatus Omnitrophota bacterium]
MAAGLFLLCLSSRKNRRAVKMAKILIIEDEPEQIKLITMRLEANGFNVVSASTAREGLQTVSQERPDLILLDILLPDINGLEVAETLKIDAATQSIPIIAITAVGTPDIEQKCRDVGISDFLRKPYESSDLITKIKVQLER